MSDSLNIYTKGKISNKVSVVLYKKLSGVSLFADEDLDINTSRWYNDQKFNNTLFGKVDDVEEDILDDENKATLTGIFNKIFNSTGILTGEIDDKKFPVIPLIIYLIVMKKEITL